MKVSFQTLDTQEVLQEWELTASQEKFFTSTKRMLLFSGGYGCLAGETKILNADTGEECRIDSIHEPFYALTHTGKKALAIPPVKYKKAPLFRVSLSNGRVITVTAEHRFYTYNGWKALRDIGIGESLFGCAPSPGQSMKESFRSILFSSVLRWLKIIPDSPVGCRSSFHSGGGQLQTPSTIAPTVSPLPVGVPEYNRESFCVDEFRLSLEHNQTYRRYDPLSSRDASRPSGVLLADEASCTSLINTGFVSKKVPFSRQLYWMMSALYNKVRLWLCNSYGDFTTVVDNIQYERFDHYYNLHILGVHDYYAEGVFSKNCGKSLILTLKALDLALKYPKNFVLMGRKTYPELRDSLLKEFFQICPDQLIENYSKSELKVKLINDSEIIFRHLDKIAATEIRSMNLGAAFVDQAEDISKDVILGLKGRLRRHGIADGDRKLGLSMNPALTWHFADFKQNPQPDHELIEASTLENKDHLPPEYVADLLSYPEAYKRQFVYGIWDESLLSTGVVFAPEYIEKLSRSVREPLREFEGLKIYADFIPGHRYQLGIDVAEASEEQTEKKDKSSIVIADLTTFEEVAAWVGQVPPDVVAEKAASFARLYQNSRTFKCLVIPEMNSIGLALVTKLKQETDIEIYHREEFDKSVGKRLKKLGWRTTRQSKPLLVNHFQELLRKKDPKVRTKETIEEFKTFIYSDESRKSGMGAKTGFHDDRIMSLLLAFFEPGEVKSGAVLSPYPRGNTLIVDVQPTLIIKNGKAQLRGLEPRLPIKKWTTI